MKCTACKKGSLINAYLEGSMLCRTCDHCGGNLLMLSDYLNWKAQHIENQLFTATDIETEAEETDRAMICPITGQFMIKYRISKDTDHRLDLSPCVNAIWLDNKEWELLKASGLAHKLNNVFSDHWQSNIRIESSADFMATMYQQKFGSHYETIKNFRELLDSMQNKPEVLAYLFSEDPYKS